MKNIRILLCLCICMFFNVGFTYSKEIKGNDGDINPLYLEYEKLSDAEKEKVTITPNKYIHYYKKSTKPEFKKGTFAFDPTYPTTFDLRNVNGNNYVAPIDNQGQTSLCWAFSANNSLESYMLKNSMGEFNFSERQLDYALSKDGVTGKNLYNYRELLSGGSNFYVNLLWFGGVSPVTEEVFGAFNELNTVKTLDEVLSYENVEYDVTGVAFLPSFYIDSEWNNTELKANVLEYNKIIKTHIMNYGAISSSIYWYFFNPETNLLYNPGTADFNDYYDTGHAATIIGWNDSYGDIDDDGIGDGAWLIQNTWGGIYSYYYVSYYDENIVEDMIGVKAVEEKDWDNMYFEGSAEVNNISSNTLVYNYEKDNSTEALKYIKLYAYNDENETSTMNVSIKEKSDASYINIGDFNITDGISIINLGDYEVDDDFQVKFVSDNLYYSANLVTSNVNSVQPSITISSVVQPFDIDYSLGEIVVLTKGINTGEILDVKIVNENNVDITSRFDIVSNPVVNDITSINFNLKDGQNLNNIFDFKVIVYKDEISDEKEMFIYNLEGKGTEEEPYLISSVIDFRGIGSHELNSEGCYKSTKYFKLVNNINFLAVYSDIHGIYLCNAVIDGDGYTIYNYKSNIGAALFNTIKNVEIKNLRLDYFDIKLSEGITGVNEEIAPLASGVFNSKLSNIYIGRNVKITNEVSLYSSSGMVGYFENSSITNSYSEAVITSYNQGTFADVVGIVGNAIFDFEKLDATSPSSLTIENNYFNGTIAVIEDENSNNVSDNYELYGVTGNLVYRTTPNSTQNPNGYGMIIRNNYFTNNELEEEEGLVYYYPTDTIGNIVTSGDASLAILTSSNNLKKTNAEMLEQATYAGFDFTNTWNILENKTPILRIIKTTPAATSIEIDVDYTIFYLNENGIFIDIIAEPEEYVDIAWSATNENVTSMDVDIYGGVWLYTQGVGTSQLCVEDINGGAQDCVTIEVRELKLLNSEEFRVDNTSQYVYMLDSLNVSDIISGIGYQAKTIEVIKNDENSSYVGTGSVIKFCGNSNNCYQYETIIPADVNGDGEIDVFDLINVQKEILGIEELSKNSYWTAADYESDDEIDIFDLIKINKRILGME